MVSINQFFGFRNRGRNRTEVFDRMGVMRSVIRGFLMTPILLLLFTACDHPAEEIIILTDLKGGRNFAVPTGTVADRFVLEKFPDARVTYYNSIHDCALAVRNGKADAAVYDQPVLKNIAAKNSGLKVLDELLFPDAYGFAVALGDTVFRQAADATLEELKISGMYDEMLDRWFPQEGDPGPMPEIKQEFTDGELLFGTAAVTEPMSYIDSSHGVVGFDIELAYHIARKLNRRLEIVNMEFGAMLPALISGKVHMIGAGLSITEERAKSVLFCNSYYQSGIAALVRSERSKKDAGPDPGQKDKPPVHYRDLGVLMGSIYEGYAHKTYPEATIHTYNTVTDMLAALAGAKIDGGFVDHSVVKEILIQNNTFEILEANLFKVDIALGFHQKSDALRLQFNQFLKEIRSDGTYKTMVKRWISDTGAIMPEIPYPQSTGVLRVGVVSDIGPPMSAKTNDQWSGLDIELSLRFGSWLGRRVELVDLPFGSLIPSLVSGKIDMIAASMMITQERSKQVDFSDPYFVSGGTILGKKRQVGQTTPASSASGNKRLSILQRFGQRFYSNLILEKRYLMILKGLYVTLVISILAALFGTMLGGVVCAGRMSGKRYLRSLSRFFIGLIRGTPVLVLLMIIYYVIFASVNINPVLVAVIAFGINFAAYVSEMFRTSIESIGRGQREAGIASGFTSVQTFILIILPQAVRRLLPVYKGEFISLVKMTSVVGYIAVEDLTKASDIIRSRTFDAFFPLIMAAVLYILISWLLTAGLSRIEINLEPYRRIRKQRNRKEIYS